MDTFEKLGAFYLGKSYDPDKRERLPDYMLYDSKDLLTHAVCVGMTGSGKTGLCLSLLEEAAMDNIPAIIIDPKGDMANLFLTFPELRPVDFEPWVNPSEAATAGRTVSEYAADQAGLWQKGLADWDQDQTRIATMRSKVELALYTPGSTAGIPVSVLQSFTPQTPGTSASDHEMVLEQVSSTVSGLLSLLGIDADPVQSREHILLSNILTIAADQGKAVDLATLIGLIQQPPLERIGVMALEDFYPSKDRFALAMQLNNLLASPRFATWLEGQPLDIDAFLFNSSGKPKLSIFSISHLSESERMFFVTTLLNQVVSWTRRQSGTGSLRAILYMDEIFGFFPPVANPPSKTPLLTLLKQARAYGLGVVLTTQNPADLDYKGLSNTGTWFIGRLQTDRDKTRVLEGLEGVASSQGIGFDRAQMDKIISGLDKRVFLMNNVHDRQPTLFQTRWCMSYLRGPMTRDHIQILKKQMEAQGIADPAAYTRQSGGAAGAYTGPAAALPTAPAASAPVPAQHGPVPAAAEAAAGTEAVLPKLPTGIRQYVLPPQSDAGGLLDYRPMLLGYAQIGYRDTKNGLQESRSIALATPISEDVFVINWDEAETLGYELDQLNTDLPAGANILPLPEVARQTKSFTAWKRELTDWLYRNRPLQLYHNPTFKMLSQPEEAERDFKIRVQQHVRETRDLELEKLRTRYAAKMRTLEERIRKAEQAVQREKEQAKTQGLQTAISFGATLLSAFLGKKAVSATTVGKATTAVRGASRAMKEKGDIDRSRETVEAYKQQLADLEKQFETETDALSAQMETALEDIQEYQLNPLKKDIMIRALVILWQPF